MQISYFRHNAYQLCQFHEVLPLSDIFLSYNFQNKNGWIEIRMTFLYLFIEK